MEQLPGDKDTIFMRLKNSIKKLWVEHYNYKPLQLVILSCIAGSTPFLSIGLSQLLPESFASEKDVPTTTVIMESPEESTVTETVEHYVTMPNGDIKTYTDDPNSSYSNKEPQDEQVDTTTQNNNTNNDELAQRKNNDYNSRYENTPTPKQNLREYPTYNSPEPTLNNKQSPNDNTVRTPQNNIPHNNTNNNTNSNNSNNTGDARNTNSNNSNNDSNMNNNMNTDSNNNVNNDY